MSIFGICAAAVAVCLASQLLRDSREIKTVMILFAAASVFIRISGSLSDIIAELRRITEAAGFSDESLGILLRSAAICIVSQLSFDLCTDAGEKALASQIDLAARAALLLNALPLFGAVIALIEGLLI